MTERTGELDKELQEYGTTTDGAAPTTTTPAEGNEAVENPVGFDAEADQTEETSIETTDEGERSSVEEI